MPWISHNAGESGIGLQEEDGHPTKAGCRSIVVTKIVSVLTMCLT